MDRLEPLSGLFFLLFILGFLYLITNYSPFFNANDQKSQALDNKISYERTKEEIRRVIFESLFSRNIHTILVADYLNLDNKQDKFGRYLAEDFSSLFSQKIDSFKVIDRSKLNLLLEEQNLKASGLLDEKTVSELGKIIGVQAVITGKYQIIGEYLKLWIKVIDIEKSELLITNERKIFIDGEIKDALKINAWWN